MSAATDAPISSLGYRHAIDLSQAVDPTGKDLLSIIREEHEIVLNLYDRYGTCGSDVEKMAIGYNLIKLLSIHSAKEEMVLYPLIRVKFPNGGQVADLALQEHLQLKKDLYELDHLGSSASLSEIDAIVQRTYQDLKTHLEHEEAEILTQLLKHLSTEEYKTARDSFVSHLALAPSHPHPDAPDQPPANAAANAASVPLDAAKDMTRFSSTKPTKSDLLSGNVLEPNFAQKSE